jgi:hypothetical protein
MLIKFAFVGEKNFEVSKMHGTSIIIMNLLVKRDALTLF